MAMHEGRDLSTGVAHAIELISVLRDLLRQLSRRGNLE